MRKIHDFSSFSALYEATDTPIAPKSLGSGSSLESLLKPTESSKLYDQTLGLILTTALNSYSSELTFPIKSYDANIDADMESVKSSPVEDKPEALKKIMAEVQSAAADNTLKGAKEAVDSWVDAGSKAADALEAMIAQYKESPEELKHINDYVNAKIDSFLKEIQDSSKENDLKNEIGAILAKNESEYYMGSDEIFEGFLQGKKGMIEDVAKQITLVTAKLASIAQTPGMAADVQKLQSEVNQISAKMGDLLDKKNNEISKDEIKKAAARLAEIPTEADKMAEKMLKQDATNKEAAAILVQALDLVQTAKNKEIEYLKNKDEDETNKKASLKAVVIEYNPEKTKNENPKVKELQQLITDKFKNVKSIAGLSQFKKMGLDGKFGPATAEIVKIMKSGYGLENPSSPDITNELYAELKKDEVIKESRILSFSVYSGVSEAFDVQAAVSAAKSSSDSTNKKYTGPSKQKTSSSVKMFKQGDKGPEVTAIQNVTGAKVSGGDEGKNQLFGPITKQAVIDWQKANGFTGKDADGIVGPATIKKMAEMKNLGTWTASVISKLAGSEVKAFVKPKETVSDSSIQTDVDTLVDDLDGIVTSSNLNSILSIVKKYVGKNALADDDKTAVEAIPRLMLLYKRDEDGDTLYGDVESVGLKTLDSSAEKTKKAILNLLKPDLNKPNGDI